MSSLYELMNGPTDTDLVSTLCKWAGIEDISFPRFRDITVSIEQPIVTVLTRTGGNNRECYEEENEACTRPSTYIEDEDCYWDNTFMEFKYSVRDEYIDEWKRLSTRSADGQS